MRTLTSALRSDSGAGEPLPVVWPSLMDEGVEFRRGQVTLIAAAPGVGKSLLANVLAVRAKVPTLYISADTDSFSVATRVGAHLTGRTINEVENTLDELHGRLDALDWIAWDFAANVSIDDIVLQVKAFNVKYGEPPWLIVVDNLSSMLSDEANPYLAHRYNVESLNVLARESGACVVILHHLTGMYESGDIPPNLGSLEGKVAKVPSMVLTLWNGKYGDLGVAICKNRFGPADAGGFLRTYLPVEKGRVKIG